MVIDLGEQDGFQIPQDRVGRREPRIHRESYLIVENWAIPVCPAWYSAAMILSRWSGLGQNHYHRRQKQLHIEHGFQTR
jgi:hypothetical protein